MAYKTDISVGAPPLLWSNVQQAFDEINQNFLELGIALGNQIEGLNPLDFTNLETTLSPNNSNEFSLGTASKTWKSLYVAEWFNIPGNQLNGVWLGDAQIKGSGTTVDLPANSTVNGELIINPANTSFKTIAVPTQTPIVADSFTDTLNIIANSGIVITTDAGTDTLTVTNDGVRSLQGSTYIGVSSPKGDNVTLTNLGVTNLTAGAGIQISGPTGGIEITNTGIRGITSGGGGITVSIDSGTRIASIGNSTPTTRSFATIRVDNVTDLVASSATDVLRVISGYGIELSTASGLGPSGQEDQLTISFDNQVDIIGSVFANNTDILVDATSRQFFGDLNGSVFSDNSSLLVDAVDAKIVGVVETTRLRTSESEIALGSAAGSLSQGSTAIAIGASAGTDTQGISATAIGAGAGSINQGTAAVAIGSLAGNDTQGAAAVAIGQGAAADTQGSNAIALGYLSGNDNQGTGAIALGYTAAQITQGDSAVAIGWSAGQTNQGDYAIAIGYRAGFANQHASSIVLNGSGVLLNTTGPGLFVNPVQSAANGRPMIYDTSTSELIYSSVLEFIGSKISTVDSSGIVVDVPVTFNTQVNVEGTLTVNDGITGYISLIELQAVVAASSDFADFQSRISAL